MFLIQSLSSAPTKMVKLNHQIFLDKLFYFFRLISFFNLFTTASSLFSVRTTTQFTYGESFPSRKIESFAGLNFAPNAKFVLIALLSLHLVVLVIEMPLIRQSLIFWIFNYIFCSRFFCSLRINF